MVDLASGQVSHGHVDGLFRLSYPPFPFEEGLPPWHGSQHSNTDSTLHVVPSSTKTVHGGGMVAEGVVAAGAISPSASGCGCHNGHRSAIDPRQSAQ